MIELVLLACLQGEPRRCEEFHLSPLQPLGMQQCLTEGQLRLVSWSAEHPDWTIKRWTCGPPRA
jgi:hypothetical protein